MVGLARVELSKEFYGISWEDYFPRNLAPGSSVELSNFEEFSEFLKKHEARSLDEKTRVAYYRIAGDYFAFRHEGVLAGVFVGTPVDWSTYYLRYALILPEFRLKGLWQGFLTHFLSVLKKYGIERVEGDVSPSNLGQIHTFNKMQFNITGMQVTERWGTVLKFTKYLSGASESQFLDRFCEGVQPQRINPERRAIP